MTPRLVFRRGAREDLRAARDWYDMQVQGLGIELGQVVDATLERIVAYPELFPQVEADIRRAVLTNFPYAIFYRVRPHDIEVLAVFHHRRDAALWQTRG
jgi:plasmid stabilization system protein ParE